MFLKVPLIPAAVLFTIAGLFLSCSSGLKRADSPSGAGGRKTAANFVLADGNGTKVALADYKGKVVLLNFWATWCGPCKVEIPWFVEFQKEYADRGFTVLGVSMDDDGWKSVKPYVAEKKINYPVVIGNDEVSKLYGEIDSLPTTFVIGRNGMIAAVHTGLVGKDAYETEIQSLLGGGQRADATEP